MKRTKHRPDRWDPVKRLLLGQRALLDVTYEDLAALTGISKTTVHDYMLHPWKMKIDQLRTVCRALHIEPAEIRPLLPL